MEAIALATLANAFATFLLGLGIGLHMREHNKLAHMSLIAGCVIVVGLFTVPY